MKKPRLAGVSIAVLLSLLGIADAAGRGVTGSTDDSALCDPTGE